MQPRVPGWRSARRLGRLIPLAAVLALAPGCGSSLGLPESDDMEEEPKLPVVLLNVSDRRQFGANLPLSSLFVANAHQFCSWVGGRLPAETEWQYVATNLGTTRFPWGDASPSCELSVLGSPTTAADADCRGSRAEVCSVPGDRTALGVCDLAGNVSELVVVPGFHDSAYALGGDYETPADTLSLLIPEWRGVFAEWYPLGNTGFRCVR